MQLNVPETGLIISSNRIRGEMNGNDDNSMHTARKRATSVLHVHSHMAKCADVCVRLCVERAIVALGSVWRWY